MWIFSLRSSRFACRAEAMRLITLYGEEGVRVPRNGANEALRDDPEGLAGAEDAKAVGHLVERQFGVRRQPDTALRWLEEQAGSCRGAGRAGTPAAQRLR